MPQLTIITDHTSREISFSYGSSVREILDGAGVRIRCGCRGNGACGLCLVQIEAGEVSPPTKSELLHISTEQLRLHTRLACQVTPESDLSIRILNTVAQNNWRDLPRSHTPRTSTHYDGLIASKPTDGKCGLAVDLGTTHIGLSLWDIRRGERICGRLGMNPQFSHGADVVTRLIAANESPENSQYLARIVLDGICGALSDMCLQKGLNPGEVSRIVLVGNTPMLALLTEVESQVLLQPRFWTSPIDCQPNDPQRWIDALGIDPEATIDVVQPFAGFVGSDLLAGVLATHLTDAPGALLIDFGTNSEMAFWDGRTLWVTSAAGGPAFESCETQCGMPAEPGAICGVKQGSESSKLQFDVIGDGEAKGLCGSGLVDLIACLRSTGELKRTGKLTPPHGDGFVVQETNPIIRLTNRDIDMFQRAKAAIGVGIHTLLSNAGMRLGDLKRVCVCGAFGRHIDIPNAQSIGLLPQIPTDRVELCGNTALAGCERVLMTASGHEELESLRKQAVVINLSQLSNFDELFMENLYLQPLEEGQN